MKKMQHLDLMWIRIPFLSVNLLFLIAACNGPADRQASPESGSTLPNIVYILVDDMGYGDLGCYGQERLSTPNIDRLAAEGMRFTRHYAGATVCAPSRASLLTGKHTGHTSVRGNKPDGQLLLDSEVTIPEVLKEAGYATAVIGKWGVGHPPPPGDPRRNGFEHAYGYINMWHAHNFYPEFLYLNGDKKPLEGNVTDWSYDYPEDMPEGTGVAKEKGTYVLDEFEQDALAFIEQHRDQPFFLYLALNMPHANNEALTFTGDGMEVPDHGRFASENWPAPEKGFARMMELIDQSVGKVMTRLKDLGLEENTLVIFASDNGPHQEGGHQVDFFDSNGPLRGQKRDLYDGGIRIPMIARWPGHILLGSTTDHLSAFWDVLPTFCEVIGVEKPVGIDGISFLPTLMGNAGVQEQHDFLYWEFYELGGRQALLKGDWKLVKLNVRSETEPVVAELYNLADDPGETTNVIERHPEIASELERLMETAHQPHPLISLFAEGVDAETPF